MAPIAALPARIALVDDHPLFRMGLRAVLEHEPGFEIVGEIGSAEEALELAERCTINLAIVDLLLPQIGGVACTVALRKLQPTCIVLGLSMLNDPFRIAEMMRAGAAGFLLKTMPPAELVESVHLALGGMRFLPPSVSRKQIDLLIIDPSAWPLEKLTTREREVFTRLASGESNDDIATHLFIARRTVETHRQRVMHKLGARSLVDLVRLAMRHGMAG